MGDDTCKMPGCDENRRGLEDAQDGFAANFCCKKHELRYEHIKADAEDARRAEEKQARDDGDWPERDGPPY